jgi:hypothetical protein
MKGTEFKPKVFQPGSYKIILKDTERNISEVIEGVLPARDEDEELTVTLY